VNRQTTLGLPAADGALVALKKGGDFLPGVETVFRLGLRRRYESSLWQNPTGATYRAHFGEVEGGTPNIINQMAELRNESRKTKSVMDLEGQCRRFIEV